MKPDKARGTLRPGDVVRVDDGDDTFWYQVVSVDNAAKADVDDDHFLAWPFHVRGRQLDEIAFEDVDAYEAREYTDDIDDVLEEIDVVEVVPEDEADEQEGQK